MPTLPAKWTPLPSMSPAKNWKDELFIQWANGWPYYKDPGSIDYTTLNRYYTATHERLGGKIEWVFYFTILATLGATLIAFAILYWFFIQGRGYLAMEWYYAAVYSVAIGFAGFYIARVITKKAMFDVVFEKTTISFRNANQPGRHQSKIITVYPALSRMQETNIHHGSQGRKAASIIIPIYVDITEIEKPDGSFIPITDEHAVLHDEALQIPAEKRNNSWLPRGFTLRIAQTIYGRMKGVTIHGEIESGMKRQAQRILAEVITWMPTAIVWTFIVISLFTGFSVAETVGQYTEKLPEGIRGLLDNPY